MGQAVLFVVALALVAAHTLQHELSAKEGVTLVIDPTTFELLAIMVLALVLHRVAFVKASASGVEIGLEAAERGVKNAVEAAGLSGVRATAPSEHLDDAVARPLVSVEGSRRALAQALRGLADAAAIGSPASDLPALARQLHERRLLSDKALAAVTDVATAIRQAKSSGASSPSVAMEIDYATQLLIGLVERQRQDLSSGAPRATRPPSP